MTLNPNVHQGFYAEGMIASLAAAAGFDVYLPRLGHGIDLGVYRNGPKNTSTSRQIMLQVKSWSTPTGDDEYLHYPIENSAYNYLAGEDHDVRHYLALVIVPPDAELFTIASSESLVLHHSAYWMSFRNRERDPQLNPKSRTVVHVPKRQQLTVHTLAALVNRDESGAVI